MFTRILVPYVSKVYTLAMMFVPLNAVTFIIPDVLSTGWTKVATVLCVEKAYLRRGTHHT